jgi:hypothetical protein
VTTIDVARPPRISGLDVARAIALFGMFAAHVGNVSSEGGWPWLIVSHGRASALFTVLAGVSIALMLSRSTASQPVRHTRIRVAIRGALLLVLGWALAALETPVDIILDNLGVMFFLALIALRWGPWLLIGSGAAFLMFGKALLDPLVRQLPEWLYNAPVVHELWGAHYPALVWIGYVLIGMGVGKLAPWRGRALGWLAASGIVLALLAHGASVALGRLLSDERNSVREQFGRPSWYSTDAHSYTAFETLGNVGVAVVAIAACCALAALLPRLTWPFAATGSMTLTLYSAHIVLIAIVGAEIVYEPSNTAYVALCAGCLVFASVWKRFVGQGPLEAVLTRASTVAADFDARRHVRASV